MHESTDPVTDVVWVQGAGEEVSAGTGVPGQAAQVCLPGLCVGSGVAASAPPDCWAVSC